MTRTDFLKIAKNKANQSLLYNAYLEFRNPKELLLGMQDFATYITLWSHNKRIDLGGIIQAVSDYYCLRFKVVRLFDKNNNLLKIY